MRNRSPSPLQSYPQQPSQSQKKYYTRQQVSQILRAMMQNKLTNIYQQLQQKQQIIKTLNEKLNNNDIYLSNCTNKLNQIMARSTEISQKYMNNMYQIVNKIINQKLQGYWHTVQNQLDKIRSNCQDGIRKFHQNLQQKTNKMLSQIKKNCQDNVQAFKKKNNAYWIKVKQALNKMNTRTVQCQQKMSNIGIQINKFQTERQENSKTIKQLQNGKNTAKMLLQLKKSVNNVYKNFQEVLKLQKSVKENYQKNGFLDKWNCDKCTHTNAQIGNNMHNNKNQWNFNTKNKVNANKPQDIVILEYSIEQDTISNHQTHNLQQTQTDIFRPHSKSQGVRSIPASKFNRNDKQGQNFPLSPITGKIIQNSNYSNTQILLGSDRYKTTHQTANTNSSMKNQTLQWIYNQDYLNSGNVYSDNKNQRSQSFQLTPHNSSNNNLYNLQSNSNSRLIMNSNNQVSTSMLNFSLECRKQMLESVRPRLLEMIEAKGLTKPIKVHLDQINYLKNQDGNYLFDLKGNMFKLTPSQFTQLQRDIIIVSIQQQKKIKR